MAKIRRTSEFRSRRKHSGWQCSAPPRRRARPGYDGIWSVVIVTEKGACDRAYRYPIRIRNGAMLPKVRAPPPSYGKVASNGQVTVTVSAGSKSATGSGRLSGTAAPGSWTGGECSGTWEAERRGA